MNTLIEKQIEEILGDLENEAHTSGWAAGRDDTSAEPIILGEYLDKIMAIIEVFAEKREKEVIWALDLIGDIHDQKLKEDKYDERNAYAECYAIVKTVLDKISTLPIKEDK